MTTNYSYNTTNTSSLSSHIEKLTAMYGISSDEFEVSTHLKEILKNYCTNSTLDEHGNVIGFIEKDKNAKTLMLEAHIDRIGLMVSEIYDDGMLGFTNIGGVDERILPSCEVTVFGKNNIYGVIFSTKKTQTKNPSIEDMRIDTFMSKNDVEKSISVGDMILIKSNFSKLKNHQFSSGAMDNRAGVAAVIEALSRLNLEKLKYNIAVLFSTQEELGLHGAYTGAYSIKSDAAIVVDVTHGATPDSKNETGVFQLGCGAVICRGPNFDYEYSKQLINISKKLNIPYAIEVASGPSGTDAWALQITGPGTPAMLISIPLKYMHTNVETLQLSDVDAVVALLVAAVEGGISLD